MITYILRRIAASLPVFFMVSFITFILGNMSAGDAARLIAVKKYEYPTKDQIETVRKEMGLDKPLLTRYGLWLLGAAKGDFGVSYRTEKPVVKEIAYLFPRTLKLAIMAFLMLLVQAFLLGTLSTLYSGSLLDKVIQGYCFLSVSIPGFWLALLLLFIFGVKLKIISVIGGHSTIPIVPAFTMSFSMCGIYIRLVRTSMEKVLQRTFVKAARTKGLRESAVMVKHVLKNALIPVVNRLGIAFSGLLSGSAIIETVFSWNGLGKYALDSIKTKNYPVTQCFVLFMALLVVVINLLVDILCRLIDPRVKME